MSGVSGVVQQHMLCWAADVISRGAISICWQDRNLEMFCKKMIAVSSNPCESLCCCGITARQIFLPKRKNPWSLLCLFRIGQSDVWKKFIKLFHPKFDAHQSLCTICCWGHVQESDALMAGGVPHWEAFVGFSADVHPSETITLSCFQSKKSTLCIGICFPCWLNLSAL